MPSSSGLGKRIKDVRRHFSMKQEEFAGKIGLSGNRLSEIEHEKGGTKASVLLAVCREFDINPGWLVNGEGEMFKPDERSPRETTNIAARVADLEAQMRTMRCRNGAAESGVTAIPLYHDYVAAGYPDPATSDIDELIDIPSSWVHGKKQVYALRVGGESMVGIGIMPGDMLIVEAKHNARDGQVVIASINGEMTVKKLNIDSSGAVVLLPENPSYKPIPVTTDMDFRILGVVLASLRNY